MKNLFAMRYVLPSLLLCLVVRLGAQAIMTPSTPYDVVIVGFDTEVDGKGSDLVGLLLSKDMPPGFRLGIASDYLLEASSFADLSPVYIEMVYQGTEVIERGTILKLLNEKGTVSIRSDVEDLTSQFEIKTSENVLSAELLTDNGTLLTLYSGFMVESPSGNFIMGTILDMIGYGLDEVTRANAKIPPQFSAKDIFVTDLGGSLGGDISTKKCDICDLLDAILDGGNWTIVSGTKSEDIAVFAYDITDCIVVECDGTLSIEVDTRSCSIIMVDSPCQDIASYRYLKTISGVPTVVQSGVGPGLPPLQIDDQNGNGTYTLEITCADGCVYSDMITVDCYEPECTAELSIVVDDCTLTATVIDCEDYDISWFYLDNGGTTLVGTTDIIMASETGLYYAVVSGCDNCPDLISNYVEMECGFDCGCESSASVVDCVITVVEDGCQDYLERWEVFDEALGIWKYIDHTGLVYTATEDGLYRRVLSHDDCEDEIATAEVSCQLSCEDFSASAFVNQDCEIEITWQDCDGSVVIYTLYAANAGSDCAQSSNYLPGGGQLQTGVNSAVFVPSQGQTCYRFSLNCGDDCIETVEVYYENCCEGALTISESACTLSATNIPCTGTMSYEWYRDGVVISAGNSTSVPDLLIDDDATYMLEVTCSDGCMYPSNIIVGDCAAEECTSEVSLSVVGQCEIEVIVTNCPDVQVQWQQLVNGVYQDLPGETSSMLQISDDGSYRPLVSNCPFCTPGDLSQPVYEAVGCEDACACDISLAVDPLSCEISSSNSDCSGILFSFWEYENPPGSGNWVYIEECIGNCSYNPPFNGNFRKGIILNDGCDTEYEEISVDCVEECVDLIVIIEELTDDCYLKASWYNCFTYDQDNFGWYISGSTEANCENSGYIPLPQPMGGIVIETYHNPGTGEGYQIIDPSHGQGCYFFNIQCNETCEIVQEKHWWEDNCCEGLDVEIVGNVDNSCSDLTAVVTGGLEPFTYLWSGIGSSGTEINQSTEIVDLDLLNSGESIELSLSVIDANGCQNTQLIVYTSCDCFCDQAEQCQSVLTYVVTTNDYSLQLGNFAANTIFNWSFDTQIVADQLEIQLNSIPVINTGAVTIYSECGCSSSNICSCSDLFLGDHVGEVNVPLLEGVCDVSDYVLGSSCSSDETTPLAVYPTTLSNGLVGTMGGSFQLISSGELVLVATANNCSQSSTYMSFSIACGEEEPPLLSQDHLDLENLKESIGSNDVTSTEIQANHHFSIHPNPARSYFDVDLPQAEGDRTVLIYEPSGRMVKSIPVKRTDRNLRIGTEDMMSGLYIVMLNDGQRILGHQKLVVIK